MERSRAHTGGLEDYAKNGGSARISVYSDAGMCLAMTHRASDSCLCSPGVKTIMSRTVGMAVGVLIFVLFFASIGARFSRPVAAAQASASQR
jgi:hypothetical protein